MALAAGWLILGCGLGASTPGSASAAVMPLSCGRAAVELAACERHRPSVEDLLGSEGVGHFSLLQTRSPERVTPSHTAAVNLVVAGAAAYSRSSSEELDHVAHWPQHPNGSLATDAVLHPPGQHIGADSATVAGSTRLANQSVSPEQVSQLQQPPPQHRQEYLHRMQPRHLEQSAQLHLELQLPYEPQPQHQLDKQLEGNPEKQLQKQQQQQQQPLQQQLQEQLQPQQLGHQVRQQPHRQPQHLMQLQLPQLAEPEQMTEQQMERRAQVLNASASSDDSGVSFGELLRAVAAMAAEATAAVEEGFYEDYSLPSGTNSTLPGLLEAAGTNRSNLSSSSQRLPSGEREVAAALPVEEAGKDGVDETDLVLTPTALGAAVGVVLGTSFGAG
mmetsp:Transcript_119157/g.297280  ORF Transcript_119157/g.297280 Transcript_119157/m.297280 type:complete len:388 (+) Transcript_119157:144-1307(+)